MDELYKYYWEERNSLVNSELDQSRQFDKYILTLASGTFGLSLLFIKQLVPSFEPYTVWYLISSWIFFSFSIVSTLISFVVSQSACARQRMILGKWYDKCKEGEEMTDEEMRNPLTKLVKGFNYSSMTFFLLGVFMLIIFGAINLLD